MTTTALDPIRRIPDAAPAAAELPVSGCATLAARFDIYATIHKALRSCMSDTLVRVGRMDADDPLDRDQALGSLDRLLDFCTDHLRHENDFLHTAIEARRPGGSARLAAEHREHVDAIDALRAEAKALQSATSGTAVAALRLYRRLARFIAENLEHMDFEETENNALLCALYTDGELLEIHGRLLASLSPMQSLDVARWMIPACSPKERVPMVAGMKAAMPPEALLGVLNTVRPHPDAGGWEKLARVASVSPTLAG